MNYEYKLIIASSIYDAEVVEYSIQQFMYQLVIYMCPVIFGN